MAAATLTSSWRLLLLFGAVVASLFTGVGGAASADNAACGQTITESIVLTADLNCSGNGLRVEGQNITVDLNGHTISGSGVGTGISTPPAFAFGTTVMNGGIRDVSVGVGVSAGPNFNENQLSLRHLTITSNDAGVSMNNAGAGGFLLIEDSTISHNGFGIGIGTDSENVRVLRNRISNNSHFGVLAGNSNDGALYQDNLILRNGGGGIQVQNGTSRIIGNTVIGNGGDGIRVFEGQEALFFRYLVSHNRADKNANYGIAQMAGMPDPMTNTAKQNGNPQQCLNITCTPN